MNDILHNVIYPALSGVLVTLLTVVVAYVVDLLKRKTSTLKYGQAVGVVGDSLKAAWSNVIAPSIQQKLADGKLSDDEWADLKAELIAVGKSTAMDRLKDLRGFAPKDAGRWVEDQLSAKLGELQTRLIGAASTGEEPESDPLANAVLGDSK